MNRVSRTWLSLRASFWFTPALIVFASMTAALAMVELDVIRPHGLSDWSPRLFGAGADGSRAMLSAIATSMVTVAGVVFSITIVALSLTSTQYSPRVLRTFMRDRPTQVVLGIFLGIFAYCLVVLRTIRGGDEGTFIPSLAVLGGMAYAFAGVGVLIYFIHHVARSIQASAILARIAQDTRQAIDHLFPAEVGQSGLPEPEAKATVLPARWTVVRAPRTGYVSAIDAAPLLQAARDVGRVLRLRVRVGEFAAEDAALAELAGDAEVPPNVRQAVRDAVVLSSQRTVEQDAAFGLQQLMDIALRALSPGVNDPTTANMAIEQLGVLLAGLARRHIPSPFRLDGGQLRVIAPAPTFEAFVTQALVPVVRHAGGDLYVLERVAAAVETVAAACRGPERLAGLVPVVAELQRELARSTARSRARALRRRLRALGPAPLR